MSELTYLSELWRLFDESEPEGARKRAIRAAIESAESQIEVGIKIANGEPVYSDDLAREIAQTLVDGCTRAAALVEQVGREYEHAVLQGLGEGIKGAGDIAAARFYEQIEGKGRFEALTGHRRRARLPTKPTTIRCANMPSVSRRAPYADAGS